MKVSIKCQHCGEKVQVDDWRDNCVCPKCKQFVISISEYMRERINGKKD